MEQAEKRDQAVGTKVTATRKRLLQELAAARKTTVSEILNELVDDAEKRAEFGDLMRSAGVEPGEGGTAGQVELPVTRPTMPSVALEPGPSGMEWKSVAGQPTAAPEFRRRTDGPDRSGQRWPSGRPVGAILAVMLACLTVWFAWWLRADYRWTEEQRERWPAYVQSAAYAKLQLPASRYAFLPPGRYQHSTVHEYLRTSVYGGSTLIDLWRLPVTAGLLVLIVGLVIGVRYDTGVRRLRREGRVVKGPEELSAAQFNRRVKGDGLAVKQWRGQDVRLPKIAETTHLVACGGTGSGKSTLLGQILEQVEERDETAVVYDPTGEFASRHYNPDRGDVILHPYDMRFPGWSIGQEVVRDEEAMAVASALFTSRGEKFFERTPKAIFAHLLTRRPRPTAAQLVHELANPKLLEDVLNQTGGARYAEMIPEGASHQRGGIIAELNLVGDALSALPPEGPHSWSAARWAKDRKGWVFVTSDQSTHDRQLPLITLWLDLMILRLMREHDRRTWVVIDELASLGRLPQLPRALDQARKYNVSIVLGFQSISQLQAIYGNDQWRSMVSAPATHIVLRTTEPESQKWESSLLGDVEIQRFEETRTKNGRRWSRSESMKTMIKPLVIPSQLGVLPALEGFLKYGDAVVKIRLAVSQRPKIVAPFVPRD